MRIAVALHDVSSTTRLTDFVRTLLSFNLEVELVIFSRITGAAAQYGLPEASKTLFKRGVRFLVLQDIEDYRDIFKDYKIMQYSASKGKPISRKEELGIDFAKDKVLIIFSGNDAGFTAQEILEEALAFRSLAAPKEIPPESALSLTLHMILC
ncbi:MAG: RecB-family nuclease [Fervidicoccaceae archaeon]